MALSASKRSGVLNISRGYYVGHPNFGGALMDVVVWLRSLGLGKYEAAFRENDIDEAVLPGLTHETLKELGVSVASGARH
jgi:hypothetical protein